MQYVMVCLRHHHKYARDLLKVAFATVLITLRYKYYYILRDDTFQCKHYCIH